MSDRTIPRPEPLDWLRVLAAARSVVDGLDARGTTLDDVAASIELRHSLRRCAAAVGVPMRLVDADEIADVDAHRQT